MMQLQHRLPAPAPAHSFKACTLPPANPNGQQGIYALLFCSSLFVLIPALSLLYFESS